MPKERLGMNDIVLVTLSPITEGCDIAICSDLRNQVTRLYWENRTSEIIQKHFHIYQSGASPVSEDIEECFNILSQCGRLETILGKREYIVHPWNETCEDIKKRAVISAEDYNFLISLGRRIEVEHKYREVK